MKSKIFTGQKDAVMLIGYARTSTAEQSAGLTAQERDLRAAGAEKVFSEQVSSVVQRTALKACLEFVREGDVDLEHGRRTVGYAQSNLHR